MLFSAFVILGENHKSQKMIIIPDLVKLWGLPVESKRSPAVADLAFLISVSQSCRLFLQNIHHPNPFIFFLLICRSSYYIKNIDCIIPEASYKSSIMDFS